MTDTAVQQLADIRESWGDLLHAIAVPPPPAWPPRQPSVQHLVRDDDTDTGPHVGRLPLVLRQHPAPLNVDALDAALDIEHALFDLADQLAAVTQRSIRQVPVPNLGPRARWIADPADINDPDRWHYQTPTSPGSRANGLHWCAVWLEQRITDEGADKAYWPLSLFLQDEVAAVVAEAHATLARALGRDGRDTVLADPCPWCHGTLTARTTSGDPAAATITCDTGPTCTAPTAYDDRARRTWAGRDLVGLFTALTAARAKETAA
jgi:hypothetical protein